MNSWNAFRYCLVGSCVEVAIFGMYSNLCGRRAKISEDFMFFLINETLCMALGIGFWDRRICG